ncbi:MAG: hypothetical protein HDR88_03625 [Bacteroides sp.]|nr:hypothetical protein [Bacteroides sp.]
MEKSRVRNYKPVILSQQLKNEIRENTANLNTYEIIKYCNDKTQKLLTFSTKCEPFDDRKVTKMHCVGYAQVYATICNYAFHVNNINGSAKPVVGSVKYNDVNLNSYSKYLPKKWADFTKDHDFVEVKIGNSTYYVDAILNIIQSNNN